MKTKYVPSNYLFYKWHQSPDSSDVDGPDVTVISVDNIFNSTVEELKELKKI
jgi:hypothetical protein